METLRERLSEKIRQVIDSLPFNMALCRQCMETMTVFIQEHKELDQFEDFEFSQECVKTRHEEIPKCYNQIALVKQGRKTSLTFKMLDDKSETPMDSSRAST